MQTTKESHMLIQENLQYNTKFNFEFSNNEFKIVDSYLFLLNGNICVVSFVDGERFVNAIYNEKKELISFDNYANHVITLNNKGIDRFTSSISKALSEAVKSSPLDKRLIDLFDLTTEELSIDRNNLRFSLEKNKESDIAKTIEFISSYAKQFSSKGYLKLNLLKTDNIFSYCISNHSDKSICKFMFKLESLPNKDTFHLVQRVNYIQEAKEIDFNILNKEFSQLNSTSEQMHKDYSTEPISSSDANHYSILSKIFHNRNIIPLPLSI
jgi:hypothetical protein